MIHLPFDPPCHLCHRPHPISNFRKAHDAEGYAFYCEDCGISMHDVDGPSNVFCSSCGEKIGQAEGEKLRVLIVPISDEIFEVYCNNCKEKKKAEISAKGEPIVLLPMSNKEKNKIKNHLNRRMRREATQDKRF